MNNINRRQFSALTASAFAGGAARAQAQAMRPELAKILVPFAAGGTLDQIARLLAEHMRGDVADAIVVENKSGAAGRLAIDALRKAPADGTTLMIHAGGIQSLYPYTFAQINYDPFVDVSPVSLTNKLEFGLAVGPLVPSGVKDLKDYVAWVRLDPRNASFATPGSGTPLHFLPLLLGRDVKVEMNPVHYRGTAAAFPDLMGGQIPALSSPLHDLMQQVPTGKVRVLASSGAVRNKVSPQVATYAEQGYPALTSGDWYAIYVSGKTPPAVQERISASVRKALATPALVAAFAKAYIEPSGSTPAQAMSLAHADNQHWAAIVKTLGYVPEP